MAETETRQMTHAEITSLEHASRESMAWVPEISDAQTRYGVVLGALVPAMAILAAAAGLLIAFL